MTSANGTARLTKTKTNGSAKAASGNGNGHRNGNGNGHTNGHTNGHANGNAHRNGNGGSKTARTSPPSGAPARTLVEERPARPQPQTKSVPETLLYVPSHPAFVQPSDDWQEAPPLRLRPWDREKRYVLPLLLAGLIGIVGIVVAGNRDGSAGAATPLVQANPTTDEALPPADDVVVSQCVVDNQGMMKAHGEVVNHTTAPANYMIGVTFNDAGATKIGDGFAIVDDVAPGERAAWTVGSYLPPNGEGHSCDLTRVERGTP